MQQYTFIVVADRGIAIPDPLIMLGPGMNTFSVFTDDIDHVRGLLEDEGVTIQNVAAIEAPPLGDRPSYVLDGESEENL